MTQVTPITTSGARSSMIDVITTLRGLTNAGSADYTVNAASYWTDVQLQAVLDRHVSQITHEELRPISTHLSGGSVAYYDYQSCRRFYETTSGGTARFIVQDQTGATIGTAAYTPDYPAGLISFTANTLGMSRYVTGFSYDMNAAAADVWTQKAAHYSIAYDVNTDNHGLKRSQIIANCMSLAREFASGAQMITLDMDRSDTSGSNTGDFD
jgi:hypothetical protein